MEGTGVGQEYDLALLAYEPGGDPLGWMPHPLKLDVGVPWCDVSSLVFEYPKDSPGAEWVIGQSGGFEIAVMVWEAVSGEWIEPPNHRFVVLQWEDDVVDDTNTIRFTCPGYAWLMSKHLILKGKKDDALNKVEEDAKKEMDDAKSEMDSAQSSLNSVLSTVRSTLKYKGGAYALAKFPKTVKSGKKQVKPKNKSILFHTSRHKFYWYKSADSKWYLLTQPGATSKIGDATTKASALAGKTAVYNAKKKSYDKAKYNAREATKAGKRPMVDTTAGWAIKRHWEESQARGGSRLKGMGRTFNGTYATGKNSSGKFHRKWKERFDVDLTIGMSILDLLLELTKMGVCEWQMRGRQLDMFRPGDFNVDVSDVVGLHLGRDLTEAPDKASRHEYANYWVIRGEGNLSFGMKATGDVDPGMGWGTWEKALTASGAKKTADAKKMALKEAKGTLKRIKLESTRGLIVHAEAPRPMFDYLPGQTIRVYGADGEMQRVRVMQITLTREPGGWVSGNLVLDDRFLATALNFRNSLALTLGGYEKTLGGGTVPMLPPPPDSVDPVVRETAVSVVVGARAGINEATGHAATILNIAWTPPGEDAFVPEEPEDEPGDETDAGELIPDY
jgi:hypothetical protein